MELMTSYEEKLGKMEEDEISGEKILTDRQVEMLQAEDERNYYSSRDENPYRQYQKVTNRLKKFKKKQVKTHIARVKSKIHGRLHQNDIRLSFEQKWTILGQSGGFKVDGQVDSLYFNS